MRTAMACAITLIEADFVVSFQYTVSVEGMVSKISVFVRCQVYIKTEKMLFSKIIFFPVQFYILAAFHSGLLVLLYYYYIYFYKFAIKFQATDQPSDQECRRSDI